MFDIGNEAHVEHTISFIDDQHFATRQQYLAALEQIHQSARSCDQDVHSLFKRLDLITHLHAANQQRHRQFVIFAIFFEVFGNLSRQFAGGFKNEATWHPRARAAICKHVDHWKDETCRLACARLRNSDNVAHHLDLRDGSRLNWGRLIIASLAQGSQ